MKMLKLLIKTSFFNPNQYTWGPNGPQAYILCSIFVKFFKIFPPFYVFVKPTCADAQAENYLNWCILVVLV